MENQIKEVYVVHVEAVDDGVPYTHIELYTNADAAYRAWCALVEEEKGLHARAFDEDGEYIGGQDWDYTLEDDNRYFYLQEKTESDYSNVWMKVERVWEEEYGRK
jgi:hypothetical protein